MSLYLVTKGDRRLWVAYLDLSQGRAYVYVANTGAFHHNAALSADFYVDQELTYEPIDTAAAASAMRERVGWLDGRRKRDELRRYRHDSEALSVGAVLGEDVRVHPESSRSQAHARVRELSQTPAGTWLTWRSYPPEQRQAAHTSAHDLTSGKVRALRAVGGIRTRVVNADDGRLLVQVTRRW